jgi:CRISPR system Cascade subunit CasB
MSLSTSKAAEWWRDLQPDRRTRRPGDSGAIARLRRCSTVAEAMLQPASIDLFRAAGGTGPWDLPAAGLVAAVLSHVRDDDPKWSVARQIGPAEPDKPDTALLKPVRFRCLVEARALDERLTQFRRLVSLVGGKLNVFDLTGSLLYWNDERERQWVYDYWNAEWSAERTTAGNKSKETAS